uniref:Uncharacterized protein n=1 Tax=Mus musculus TaxID=10090 RepID=Q3UUP1_MOUSE|nr:unnamed protein product [Mus musculus]
MGMERSSRVQRRLAGSHQALCWCLAACAAHCSFLKSLTNPPDFV